MIRATLLAASLACTAGSVPAQGSLLDSFCDQTSLDALSERPWARTTLIGVTGFSGMLELLERFEQRGPRVFEISDPNLSGTRRLTNRENEYRRMLRPMDFAELNMDEIIKDQKTLGYLLGDPSIETVSGCQVERLPVFEVVGGPNRESQGRIGYLFFLTATLAYELSGYNPKADGSGPKEYHSTFLTR